MLTFHDHLLSFIWSLHYVTREESFENFFVFQSERDCYQILGAIKVYITTGLEIKTFARVYPNFELSINEKFVAYGATVKILKTFKSSCTTACYLIQKPKPIERVYLSQCFGNNFFFHNFTWRYESSIK